MDFTQPKKRNPPQEDSHGDGPVTHSTYQLLMMNGGWEEHSVVGIRNLAANALVGSDIWGSKDMKGHCNRFQPVLLSARLSFEDMFDSTAENDRLDASTVHYGTLSKEILKFAAIRGTDRKKANPPMGIERDWSLFDFLELLFRCLTESALDSTQTYDVLRGGDLIRGYEPKFLPPLLNSNLLQELELNITLPKGTLLSREVSLTLCRGYLHKEHNQDPYSSVLRLRDIQVPTLIGVNDNERLAKQFVSATVEIDPYHCVSSDVYNHLEQIIAKSMEESSFETLETLATHLAKRVIKHFIYAYDDIDNDSMVKIILEKPSATTFAETPVISITRSSNPKVGMARLLWDERQAIKNPPKLEFPHQGRLDVWIKENFPGDTTGLQQGIKFELVID